MLLCTAGTGLYRQSQQCMAVTCNLNVCMSPCWNCTAAPMSDATCPAYASIAFELSRATAWPLDFNCNMLACLAGPHLQYSKLSSTGMVLKRRIGWPVCWLMELHNQHTLAQGKICHHLCLRTLALLAGTAPATNVFIDNVSFNHMTG